MTWKEFKNAVESLGLEDGDRLSQITTGMDPRAVELWRVQDSDGNGVAVFGIGSGYDSVEFQPVTPSGYRTVGNLHTEGLDSWQSLGDIQQSPQH